MELDVKHQAIFDAIEVLHSIEIERDFLPFLLTLMFNITL